MHAIQVMMKPLRVRAMSQLAILMTVIVSLACGGSQAPPPEPATGSAPPSAPPAPASSGPRVFFVLPQDGATVTSPAKLEFGVDSFTIAPVPKETITPEQVRAGMGHHHVGIDTDCLPPGAEIPKASPWVHFGDGKSVIDMQLTPGPHKLTLQIGDDLHRTIAGLCSTISVTVAQ